MNLKTLADKYARKNRSLSGSFGKKIMYIPDVQAKPDVPLHHLPCIGKYAVEKRPDIIVLAGDFADMPSISAWDKGKKSFEGRRYKQDIASTHKALELLLTPIRKAKGYKPRIVITLGNHEDRINRLVEDNANLEGVVSTDDLQYKQHGIEEVPYKEIIDIEGVWFSHYFYSPMNGRPYSGTASNILSKVGNSFFMGHQQRLDIGSRPKLSGGMQWGIVAGACYLHEENYMGPQGNKHWRGIVMAHDVKDGDMDLMTVSLKYLLNKF
jgi:hypothetical protein